jgi:hypothetical protein
MQSAWRLREQQRKQAAADEARRRAVEVSEISFPSLASASAATTNWGVAPIAPTASAAAERWTSGAASVSSYVTPPASASTTTASKRSAGGAGTGIHARISAEVRRTAGVVAEQYSRYDYDDDYADAANSNADDGWTEVSSKTKKPATHPKSRVTAAAAPDDYFDDGEEENM